MTTAGDVGTTVLSSSLNDVYTYSGAFPWCIVYVCVLRTGMPWLMVT